MIESIRHPMMAKPWRVSKKALFEKEEDILAPMRRFKKELPIPKGGQQNNMSLQTILMRQKEFYSHRGQVYELMHNTKAAIASYQKAVYYQPSDINLSNQITRLKIKSLTNIKA